MQTKQAIEKLNDLWLRLLGIPLITFIYTVVLYYMNDHSIHGIPPLKTYFTGLTFTVMIWEGNRRLLIYFRHRLPEVNQTGRRIFYSFVSYFVFTVLFSAIIFFGLNAINYWGQIIPAQQFYFNMANHVVFILLIGGTYEMVYYFKKWRQTMEEREELKKENLQTQLDVLKSHINPHFLFNSLNTLEALAEEKNEKTSDFVRQLANVYRFILQSNDKQLCSLEEELTCVESYSFLLKTRFGNNIHFEITIPEALYSMQIPPLTLQMLVENAMKHNVVSSTKPLYIKIQEEPGNCISVSNNLQKKQLLVPSDKVGLSNIQKRFELIGKTKIAIEESSLLFKVTVPLIQHNTNPLN